MHTWYKLAQEDTEKLKDSKEEKYTTSVAIFRKNGHSIEILLEKRKFDPAKGEWAFPGGHVEGRETYSQAAKREVEEETGLILQSNQMVKVTERKRDVSEKKENCLFAYFDDAGQKIKASSDAAALKWHNINGIPKLAFEDDNYILASLAKILEWSLGNDAIKQASTNPFMRHAQTVIDDGTKQMVGGILAKASPEKEGLLLVVEGIDGVGKTSQVEKLIKWLEDKGYDVATTKWSDSDLLKGSIKQAKKDRILTPLLYSLIHAADFIVRYEQEIVPALAKNKIVVCDRYTYTSLVRDAVRKVDTGIVSKVFKELRKPDLIFYCHAPIEVAFTRLVKGKGLSYYGSGSDLNLAPSREENALKYEKLMADEYKEVLKGEAHCVKVDMDRKIDEIFEEIKTIMADEFGIGKYK